MPRRDRDIAGQGEQRLTATSPQWTSAVSQSFTEDIARLFKMSVSVKDKVPNRSAPRVSACRRISGGSSAGASDRCAAGLGSECHQVS